jgi:predicted NUDIX family phosphoesterase
VTRVHVVDRSACFGGRWPQGFLPMADDPGRDFLQRAFDLGRFEDRPTAERTPAWKQWIPYCVLRCGQRPREGHAAAEAGVFLVPE